MTSNAVKTGHATVFEDRASASFTSVAARLFPVYVFLMLFDGLIRKSTPEQSGSVTVIKDGLFSVMAVILILSLLISTEMRSRLKTLLEFRGPRFGLLAFSIVGVLSLLSLLGERGIDFQIYLLGLREYLLYVPMIFVAFDYFQDAKRRTRFIRFAILFAIVVDGAALLHAFKLLETPLLEPITANVVSHSSDFGEYFYESSIFDVPERFAVFNLFILILSAALLAKRSTGIHFSLLTMASLVSWAALFISARRVAFLLGTLVLIVILVLQGRRRFWGILLIVTSIVVLPPILDSLNSTLLKVYQTSTIDSAQFYLLEWSPREFATMVDLSPSFFYGNFGLASPGIGVTPLAYSPIAGLIEAFWPKAVYSLGVVGAVMLFLTQMLVIGEMGRFYLRLHDPLINTAMLYMICISIWNWKSGEYLVWIPLTMMIVGLGYAAAVRTHSNSGQTSL